MAALRDSRSRQVDFATTHWSLVLAAGRGRSSSARQALAMLCETYWYPLYAYVRRRGHQAHDACDLVQQFLTGLVERDSLRVADPGRGRFRSFLLGACNNFLANQRRHKLAQKRGGKERLLTLDFTTAEERYRREPADEATPEKIFERRWAMTLLERALARLREQYVAAGKTAVFEELKPYLGAGEPQAPYEKVAERLDISAAAVKVAVHRLRRRCREVLREEIAQTVAGPDEVDDELRDLFAAVGPPENIGLRR